MAFGSGVLLSAVSFELIAEAHERGGMAAAAAGAVTGAVLYTLANVVLARRGAHPSASGMLRAGRSRGYVFTLWGGIAVISAVAAMTGYGLLGGVPAAVLAAITALAGGAILAMIADTMIPEAFGDAHLWIGLIIVAGFLAAFGLSQVQP